MHSVFTRALSTLAVAAALVAPGGARAAAFGEPTTVSGRDDVANARAVIAPDGRTAIVYSQEVRVGRRYRTVYRLATGPAPDRLGPATPLTIEGVVPSARIGVATLLARRDGAFVLCGAVGRTQGCAIAPPGGGFGRFIELPGPAQDLTAVARPDGSVVLIRSQTTTTSKGIITSTTTVVSTLSADGVLGPEQPLPRSRDEQSFNVNDLGAVALDDGTVAIQANLPAPGRRDGTQLGIRLMAPGATTFGPVVTVPGQPYDNNIDLLGGPLLTVTYLANGSGLFAGEPFEVHAVRRRADGTFEPERVVPGDRRGVSASVVPLPSGELFAVTTRTTTADGDQDCLNPVTGRIGSGTLVLPSARGVNRRLSTRGQIAFRGQGAALADGTVIAAWQNGVNASGVLRAEVAVRRPGASTFAPSQRLAPLIDDYAGVQLVTGGNHAMLLWLAPPRRGSSASRLVVSALRASGPYARQAPLAKRPETACE